MSTYDRDVALWPNSMTLRDYFAAKAMQGILVNNPNRIDEKIAQWAYMMADNMLAARGAK